MTVQRINVHSHDSHYNKKHRREYSVLRFLYIGIWLGQVFRFDMLSIVYLLFAEHLTSISEFGTENLSIISVVNIRTGVILFTIRQLKTFFGAR